MALFDTTTKCNSEYRAKKIIAYKTGVYIYRIMLAGNCVTFRNMIEIKVTFGSAWVCLVDRERTSL